MSKLEQGKELLSDATDWINAIDKKYSISTEGVSYAMGWLRIYWNEFLIGVTSVAVLFTGSKIGLWTLLSDAVYTTVMIPTVLIQDWWLLGTWVVIGALWSNYVRKIIMKYLDSKDM